MDDYNTYVLAVIALLTVVSFITRSGYFLFGDHLPLSPAVRRALRYAPAAALVGIIVPEIFPWAPGAGPSLRIEVLAALAAVLVFWRTRSTVMVIVAGMVALWTIRALSWVFVTF
jgi:branched-subunit amino acid transport protein